MKCSYNEVMKNVSLSEHRRWIDRYLWEVNQSMCNDNLWFGRFVVRRLRSFLDVFEDSSGALLYIVVRFYDKKTHKRKDVTTDALELPMKMFFLMNEFIVNDVGVWENEHPYDERHD